MEYLLYRIIVSTYTIADNFMSVGTERDFIKRLFQKLYILPLHQFSKHQEIVTSKTHIMVQEVSFRTS